MHRMNWLSIGHVSMPRGKILEKWSEIVTDDKINQKIVMNEELVQNGVINPHLPTIAPGPRFSTGTQDHHHRVEWLVLQLTKRPETHGHLSRKARSRPEAVEFDPSLHHMPSGHSTAKPKIGERRFPTVAFVRLPIASTSCCTHPPPGSHVRDKIRRIVLPLEDPQTANMVFNVFDPSER